MIPVSPVQAPIQGKARESCCGGAPCFADWCRLECKAR